MNVGQSDVLMSRLCVFVCACVCVCVCVDGRVGGGQETLRVQEREGKEDTVGQMENTRG